MADELNMSGNFSIQDTMEMGAGNQELLNDLFEPETSTSSPDDIKKIEEPSPEKKEEKKPEEKKSEKEETSKDFISDFLGEDDEETLDDDKSKNDSKLEKKPIETSTDDDEDSQDRGSSKFTALANDLFNLGVFTKDDEEGEVNISSPEEFLERFESEKKKGSIEIVNSFIGQFGEDYQKAFDAIFVKGANPKEYFETYNNVVSFAEMDLSLEKNQEKVMKQALLDQGFEEEDVETEIERLKNYGDLESVSTKHHKVLVKKEASKLQEIEQKAEQLQQQKAVVKNVYINNVQKVLEEKLKAKEFDGIPLNPKLANELQDFLLVDKYKTNSGETLTDFDKTILELKRPENHATKVKIALLLKILEKDPTLSTIQKTGITKKSNQLFTEIARQVEKSPVKSDSSKSSSWFL